MVEITSLQRRLSWLEKYFLFKENQIVFTFIFYEKMKKEIQILLEFGELLSQVRSQLNIRVDLLTADLHASQRVYSRV